MQSPHFLRIDQHRRADVRRVVDSWLPGEAVPELSFIAADVLFIVVTGRAGTFAPSSFSWNGRHCYLDGHWDLFWQDFDFRLGLLTVLGVSPASVDVVPVPVVAASTILGALPFALAPFSVVPGPGLAFSISVGTRLSAPRPRPRPMSKLTSICLLVLFPVLVLLVRLFVLFGRTL